MPVKKLHITCVIDTLAGGGAEKILVILAEGLASRGHKVTLITLHPEVPDFYSLPKSVHRAYLLPEAVLECRWFQIRKQIARARAFSASVLNTRPDVVISFLEVPSIRILAALSRTNIPVIVSEHTDPRFRGLEFQWRFLRRLWYPTAAKVVMLTEETLFWAKNLRPKWMLTAISNPVLPPVFSKKATKPEWFGHKNLIAMGRLHPVKGYDYLLQAFKLLKDKFPEWNLTILGEGYLRGELEKQIELEGLKQRAFLPGAVSNPADILSQADIFVMTSQYEGFPNAICEALAVGLPVVSFDCPSGPRAIIRHGVDGLLLHPGDVKCLAETLDGLMKNSERRAELAQNAPDIVTRFNLDLYLDKWEQIIFQSQRLSINIKSVLWRNFAQVVGFLYKYLCRVYY